MKKEKIVKIFLIILVIVLLVVSIIAIILVTKNNKIDNNDNQINNKKNNEVEVSKNTDNNLPYSVNDKEEITKEHVLEGISVTGINVMCEKDALCVIKGTLTNKKTDNILDKYIKYTFNYNNKEEIFATYYKEIKSNENIDIEFQSMNFDLININSYKIEFIEKEEYEKIVNLVD